MRQAAITVRKTWITLGGISGVDVLVYGPKCAAKLGLIPAVQPAAKTRHRAVKASYQQLSTIIHKKIFVQDGQFALFDAEMREQ